MTFHSQFLSNYIQKQNKKEVFMLIEARKKELLVLQMVIQKNNCSLQELSNDLHIPKRTIKELIRKINVSLKQFLLIDEFIYSNHKGEIQ
ncbi:TPA: helix-turn-helix domain-containing protein, partial [Enterococcus faecium]|nr:helix-turn-helix domain-containing protein [Enterococcus faecium]